jgi:hypothetical protein
MGGMSPARFVPAALLAAVPALAAAAVAAPSRNPSDAEVGAALERAAHNRRVPSVLLKGLAWRQSGWRQFDAAGKPVEAGGRVGLLGVKPRDDADAARLRADWRYNVERGAADLAMAWERAPLVGVGHAETGRNVLECWFLALGRYGAGHQGDDANAFASGVLDAVASGGEGRWPATPVSRPAPEALAWGRNLLCPPAPWHFGDVEPLPAPRTVVSLPVPYFHQVWDAPDGFDGGGSCGPSSMLMVLAWAGKVAPKPVAVRDSYPHESRYADVLPGLNAAVCEPNMGAVHAKMLDYLRPTFPGVAIFYDAKATYARVKAELDAGRPVILGTRVTPAGHLMVARGYLADGRLIVNDPAGDRERPARRGGPDGRWSPTGSRYWNGAGEGAFYDWDSLEVRWVMTFGPAAPAGADKPEDG